MRLLAGWVSTSCGQAEVVGAGGHLMVVIGSAWPLLPQPSSKTSCPLGSAVGHHLGVPCPVTAFTLPSAIPADSPETRGGSHLLNGPNPPTSPDGGAQLGMPSCDTGGRTASPCPVPGALLSLQCLEWQLPSWPQPRGLRSVVGARPSLRRPAWRGTTGLSL